MNSLNADDAGGGGDAYWPDDVLEFSDDDGDTTPEQLADGVDPQARGEGRGACVSRLAWREG